MTESAAARLGASAPTTVPLDFRAIDTSADWRRQFRWPVHPHHLRTTFVAVDRALLNLWRDMPESHERRSLLLGFGTLLGRLRPLIELALVLSAAARQNLRMQSTLPEAAYLGGTGDLPAPRDPFWLSSIPAVPWAAARRIARVASWTSWPRMPGAMMAPRSVAISHNPLLIDWARRNAKPPGFRHAELLLATARRAWRGGDVRVAGIAEHIAATLVAKLPLDSDLEQRLTRLVAQQAAGILAMAWQDISALESVRRLPSSIWSGTGSYYPARAVGIEVLRRGGAVTRFDHGGATGLVCDDVNGAIREFLVSSAFVTGPTKVADAVRRSAGLAEASQHRETAIFSHDHEPQRTATFDETRSEAASRRGRPVVMYVPTIFRGFFQTSFGVIPDVVYLDWQLRLAAQIGQLPVAFVAKPHPEGLLKDQPHPLSKVATVTTARFESVMSSADVFVFDRCQSTTFWLALCTDRPVVFLDFGIAEFEAPVRETLERRLRIVPVCFDDSNRPAVDAAALEAAILGGPSRVDPTEARALLLRDTPSPAPYAKRAIS